MDEFRACRVVDSLRDRGVNAHLLCTDYDQPVARQRTDTPAPGPALAREGGVFRRFLVGFRYR